MQLTWKLTASAAICCGLLWGCVGESDNYSTLKPEEHVENEDGHEHHAHGPHGGHILELGDQHAELAMGADRVVSVYLLGDDAQTATPVAIEGTSAHLHLHIGDKEQEVELTAAPLEGEAEGQTSRFVSTAEAVPAAIADIEGIEGEVFVKIGETEKTAEIGHDHGHEGHAH